ncbi:hypothetical protein THAOC_28277, partial [Thalassiosira oceanica]
IEVPDRLTEWPFRTPKRDGDRGTGHRAAQKGPGGEQSSNYRQHRDKTRRGGRVVRPERPRSSELDEKFELPGLVGSALQVTLNRRIQVSSELALSALTRRSGMKCCDSRNEAERIHDIDSHSEQSRCVPKTDAAPAGGGRERKDTRRAAAASSDAAASRKTLGVSRRSTQLARGASGRRRHYTRRTAAAVGARGGRA